METPGKRTIKIGKANVGLIGFDIALQEVLKKELSDENAAAELFEAIRKYNYIPEHSNDDYIQALLKEYQTYRYHLKDEGHELIIRVLGRPCVSCNKIKIMVIEILDKLNIAADVEDIQELDEIWRYGITKTPALIINGETKSAGRMPTLTQIEQWIKEEAEK